MLTELCNDYPNYYCYRRLLIGSANAYGDYLLSKGVEPSLIEQQYAIAMHDLKRTLDAPELRALQHGENGLAMQYYRAGIVALLGGDAANAKLIFERCALLREMAWRDTMLDGEAAANLDLAITQRIEFMLAKARSGQTEVAIEHAQWLHERAERLVRESGNNDGLAGGFPANRLFLQAASAFGIAADFLPASERPMAIAQALVSIKRSFDTGFNDASYLRHDPDLAPLQKIEEYQKLISTTFPSL